MVPAPSPRFHVSRGTLDLPLSLDFSVRGFHPLWPAFPKPFHYSQSRFRVETPVCSHWFGLFPFRSLPTFGNRCFFLLLRLLRCFRSRVPLHTLWIGVWIHESSHGVSPIQKSPDLWIFAPPRSFSQLITSFIGS